MPNSIFDTLASIGNFSSGAAKVDRLVDLKGFGSNPGELRARVHVPVRLPAPPALVVVLHGCTQSAASYDQGAGWSQLADRHGFVLLYPEQVRSNNANLCFNWFEPGDIARGAGEALSIRQMIETVVSSHEIDADRIFITGLSAGGAMASVMLATYPEVFSSGAIIAGLPYGCASNVQEAFGAMRASGTRRPEALATLVRRATDHKGPWPTISVWHGTSDATVSPENAKAIVEQWLPLHGDAEASATTGTIDGYPHRAWRNSEGTVVVETYSITGMGHGTPLDAGDTDQFEFAGPHMLNVGISSSRRIANFWGLTEDAIAPSRSTERTKPVDVVSAKPETRQRRKPEARRLDPEPNSPGAIDVREIIENALRAGGLMK